MAPNKTLAAQLYGEFRDFFPENAVEYFVSYYDYYQPEAYVPSSDTYIEKDASVNEHIEQMRLSATKALLERPGHHHRGDRIGNIWAGRSHPVPEHGAALVTRRNDQPASPFCGAWLKCNTAAMTWSCAGEPTGFAGDIIDIFPGDEEARAIRIELFDEESRCLVRTGSADR